MQLDFQLNLGSYDRTRQEIFEVISKVANINSLNLTICHPRDYTDGINITFGPFKCNNMTGYSLIFSEFTDLTIDLRVTSAGSDTQIGGTVSTYNDLGAETA
jgi:hypothetical protein